MSELKACPTSWCDSIFGPPVLKEEQCSAYIYCPTCDVETRRFPSTAEAIAAWNTRPAQTGEPAADKTHHCAGCKERQDRIDELEASLKEATKLVTQYACEAGEAKGKLEGSEAAGIVEGWQEKCAALKAAGDGLAETLSDAGDYIRGGISGPAQREGIMHEAGKALAAWSAANGH